MKVSDGDLLFRTVSIESKKRVRLAVIFEILRQLNALTPEARSALSDFGPSLPVKDHRGRTAGVSGPIFHLSKDS